MEIINNERFAGTRGSFGDSEYVSRYMKSTGRTYIAKKPKKGTDTDAQVLHKQCFAAAAREKTRIMALAETDPEREEWTSRWQAEQVNTPEYGKTLGSFIMTTLIQLYKSGKVAIPVVGQLKIDTTEMDAAIIARANQRAQGQ